VKVFLVATHISKPSVSGDPKTTETVRLSSSLRRRELNTATVVLDIGEQKIVKDRLGTRSYDEWKEYFLTHYSKEIDAWIKTKIV
jgi:hypothetical protein